jgi:hypothetical protein
MEQYIDKNRVEEILRNLWKKDGGYNAEHRICYNKALQEVQCELDTLEVKEVNIASMADDYYDALMKEAADWMDEGTMGHCRLAYYTGCKDVLNKLQKGE